MKNLSGIMIPAVTPFDKDGTLRLDWMRENYQKWNRTDVRGIMALGSNGEFRSMDDDESFAVIQAAAESIDKEKIFIAGIGRESLHHTLTFLMRVEQANLPIDYVSVLTPCYFKGAMSDSA